MQKEQENLTEYQRIQQKFNSSRSNLLLAIILTVVNIVLYFTGSESMLLFSMSVPYYAVIFADAIGISTAGIVFAVIVLGIYLLCWGLSKKRSGWLIVALVLFILDTLGMAGMYLLFEDFSGIMDALIHVWILYYLFSGVRAAKKLKTMPVDLPNENLDAETVCEGNNEHSAPLRRVDENEKCRVLLSCEHEGRKIVYRRVKRTNQLVINDYIYDEIELLVEPAHSLYANIGGHTYEVGFDGSIRSYFKVDGEIITKKIRWY